MQSHWMHLTDDHCTLEVRTVPVPTPGANQVLLRLHAASLNRGEFIAGHGLHGKPGAKAIGMEGAGEVVSLGEGVTAVKLGDKVMGRCAGAFSEYAVMDLREVMQKPANLSWDEAASIPLTSLVVYDMLVQQGKLAKDEWLLINGVSSGVGVAALQMAKALGAKVMGSSGSADKLARLKPLGLDVALHTRNADFYDAVMQATGNKGVNLVVNTVGGSVFAESIRCLAFQGRHATVGYVDHVYKAEIDIETLHSRRLTLFGVSNKQRSPEQRAQPIPGFVADILPHIAAGRFKPLVDKVFPFAQMGEAKAYMESNQQVGKIVLAIAKQG
ncbi:MAG: zinc-binding dehydrogenase [Burkholderiaceae bacterium]